MPSTPATKDSPLGASKPVTNPLPSGLLSARELTTKVYIRTAPLSISVVGATDGDNVGETDGVWVGIEEMIQGADVGEKVGETVGA